MFRLISALLALSLALGCGGSFEVKRINSAEDKPNNVWVFFTVKKGDEPVGGLQAEDFVIYEDGEPISIHESKQTIQNPEVAAVMYTMLLVDMSGSITESGQQDALVDAAESFSDKVGQSQKVGVYAFDGSEKLTPIVPFTTAQGSVESGLERMRTFKPKDPSTNLHGAVVEGLKELKTSLDREKKPLQFGTLVVFTDGTDRAARVPKDQMMEEMDKDDYQHYEIFAIGVGAEIEESYLKDVGRDGTELVSDRAKVKDAFDKIADRIEAHTRRFYLLSYCTPARAGQHEVQIEAKKKDEGSGKLTYTFDASGFGPPPDCDPEKPPKFDLKAPVEDADDDGGSSGSSGFSVKAEGGAKK
jgi:hypothetical protein